MKSRYLIFVIIFLAGVLAPRRDALATLVLLYLYRDVVSVAADSRQHDGAWQNDDVCKVIELDPQTFFLATGTAIMRDTNTNKQLWSAFSEARNARKNHTELDGDGFVKFIDAWADRTKNHYQNYLLYLSGPDRVISQNVFGRFDAAGIRIYEAPVFKKFPSIHSVPQKIDIVEDRAYRYGDEKAIALADEFFNGTTDRAKEAWSLFSKSAPYPNAKHFYTALLNSAVEFAIKWIDDKKIVGGQVDAMFLSKGGSIEWISKKPCSKN